MSKRQQSSKRVWQAAEAAVAADAWIGRTKRRDMLVAMLQGARLTDAQIEQMLATPRIKRRLPSMVPKLIDTFTRQPELGPWLQSPEQLLALGRMTGAVLHGATIARLVDGQVISHVVEYLGHDAWQFGVSNPVGEPDADTNPETLCADVYESGLRAVRGHLQAVLPELVDDIADAAGIDWSSIEPAADPARDATALNSVLQHSRA